MSNKISEETRTALVVQAFLTTPDISEVAKKTGISRSKVYSIMKTDEFQEQMNEARQNALNDSMSYLQGCLTECAEVLMDIIRDENNSPQIKINAINTVFQNCKGLAGDGGMIAGMEVKIVDSI